VTKLIDNTECDDAQVTEWRDYETCACVIDREYLGKQLDAPNQETKEGSAVASKGGTVSAKA